MSDATAARGAAPKSGSFANGARLLKRASSTLERLARSEEAPVIAVTERAMKRDRQKCIQAGASDYVSKPVAIEQPASVMRVSRQRADTREAASDTVASPAPQAAV
jgi:CheY-like chemotaxis protein